VGDGSSGTEGGPPAAGPAARRRTPLLIFLVAGSLLTALLVTYTILHRPPGLPADADHLKPQQPADCLECHGPGKRSPRKPSHPPAEGQCFNCHEPA
jgi:hypothetical protein